MSQQRWSDCQIQILPIPVCPTCKTSDRPILVKSGKADDGSCWQRCVCRACSSRWIRVYEHPPIFGDAEE